MTNKLSLGSRVSRSLSGGIQVSTDLFIDGSSLHEYFRRQQLPSESTIALPSSVQHRPLTLEFGELVQPRQGMFHDLLDWAGYSALTLNAGGYPAGKIPLLTCCGDEICGYFACTMTLDEGTVVWRDFGWVGVDWDHSGSSIELEHFNFTPSIAQHEFRFEHTQYLAFIETLLRTEWSQETDLSTAQESSLYLAPLFAKARGLTFPNDVRFRLAEALTETDPLDLRRFGEVDPDVYDGLDSSFWDSQYKAFQLDPVACLAKAFWATYGIDASLDAIEQAVIRLTSSYE